MSITLDEKLTICETVISALRNQKAISGIMEQLPMEYQVETIRFLEFLEKNSDSIRDDDASSIKH